jgi:hypothetical protein
VTGLWRALCDDHGGVLVETALLLLFVSMAGYLALQAFGQTVSGHAARANAVLGPDQ